MSDFVRRLRIFLSSPSDVPEERQIAREVVRQLQYEPQFKDEIDLEVVAWDEPAAGVPMLATKTPQAAIDEGLPTPAKCDVVVVILWARMGTPLPGAQYKKENGDLYSSGTEWEFEDAMKAYRLHERPEVVIYRRTEKFLLDDEAPDYEHRLAQKKLVRKFFDQFVDPNTGAILRGVNDYKKPEDFRRDLTTHLRQLIAKLMPARTATARGALSKSRIPMRAQELPGWRGSPFPGLRAFTDKDAPIFFGRGREIDDLVDRIERSRFVTVVGASGSGKSSLVWAGLIPRLEANAISGDHTGSKEWLWLRLTPGEVSDNPFTAVAVKVQTYLPGLETRDISSKLASDPTSLAQLIPQILDRKPDWAELVLFIDQLEELVTLVDPAHRGPFAEMLCRAVVGGRFRGVATLRADFYHQMIPVSAGLVQLLQDGSYPLGGPDPVSLHEMIVRPAERAGLQFQGDLDHRILSDTGSEPGALALMAYLLDELYHRRTNDGRLTLQAYADLGGVAGAIGQRAEQIFSSLSPDAQTVLPHVFHRLVEVDERGTATRRRALRTEVVEHALSSRPAEEMLTAFTQARLLVTDRVGELPTVEVAHEALLRKWDRLKEWIERTQDDRRLLRQVKVAALEWDRNSRQDAYRWPEERLKAVYVMIRALELEQEREFSPTEREFIRRESDRLLQEINNPNTPHSRRSWIRERLSAIGDPRPGVAVRRDGLPDIDWCKVEVEGSSSVEVEIEGHGKVKMDLPFYIARYPVTYVQFQAFIDAPDGYHNGEIDWFGRLVRQKHQRELAEQRFKFPNHPRENVNWYQAIGFCRWLSWRLERLRCSRSDAGVRVRMSRSKLGSGKFDLMNPFSWMVRLPTEAEWQFAAAGPSAQTYPWGNSFDSRFANTYESGLGRSTAVGMYPGGSRGLRGVGFERERVGVDTDGLLLHCWDGQ